jgi:hypothetical protein
MVVHGRLASVYSSRAKKIPHSTISSSIFPLWSVYMFNVNDYVQIINHSEPSCNGQYGHITQIDMAYSGNPYYMVVLEESYGVCSCLGEELMEG